MDSLFIWLLIFAGATIALIGAFLVASEKELKRQRQQIKELTAKLSAGTVNGLLIDVSAVKDSKVAKLETKNEELQSEIAILHGKLEVNEREFAESEGERRRFKNADIEKRQLEVANQKLREELADLKEQMHSTAKKEDTWQFRQEAFEEQIANLGTELKATTATLERSQTRVKQLEEAHGAIDFDKQERSNNQADAELEAKFMALQRDLADSHIKLQAFDEVNRQLLDLEQRYEKVRFDKQELEKESIRRQGHFGDSHNAQQLLFSAGNRFLDGLQSHVSESNEPEGNPQNQVAGVVEVIEVAAPSLQCAPLNLPLAISGFVAADPSVGFNPPETATSLTAALAHIEAGRYEDALRDSESLLMETPAHREAKLCHLLASVQLHSAEGYETQIDSIKDMVDLNDRERRMVRDIFLARAGAAQKHGCDADMLRYRNWAKSVVYHNPFGNEVAEAARQ
ncbi:MAG: hypothetical protein ACREO5_02790, partial [Candidatus Binatia bacterium]